MSLCRRSILLAMGLLSWTLFGAGFAGDGHPQVFKLLAALRKKDPQLDKIFSSTMPCNELETVQGIEAGKEMTIGLDYKVNRATRRLDDECESLVLKTMELAHASGFVNRYKVEEFTAEITAYQRLKKGIGPDVRLAYVCREYRTLVGRLLLTDVGKRLPKSTCLSMTSEEQRELIRKVSAMHASGVSHGDLHPGNICRKDGAGKDGSRIFIIDFGEAGFFIEAERDKFEMQKEDDYANLQSNCNLNPAILADERMKQRKHLSKL